jgi:hypothetical protein
MYRRTILIVTVLICATLLVREYLNGEAHRYDIVTVGVGGGGSNQERGDLTTEEFLIDHKTGEVWVIEDRMLIPTQKLDKDGKLPKK